MEGATRDSVNDGPVAEDATEDFEGAFESLLGEAVDFLAEIFDGDQAVDGATVVEWFSEWRERARRALEDRGLT
jgi:hypothetical protein